jgi:hypothetical protein
MAGDDFQPLGSKRKTKSGATMQEGILTVKMEPYPEPEPPPTGGAEPGWIVREPRQKEKLREPDYDFREVISSAKKAGDTSALQRLAACAWYEYARESARLRTTAATYTRWLGVASGAGRSRRHDKIDRWKKKREEHRDMMRPKLLRLHESLKRRVERLRCRAGGAAAVRYHRRWWERLNEWEIHDPTGSRKWLICDAWERIGWMETRLEGWVTKLRQQENGKADAIEKRWQRVLRLLGDGERAWSEAQGWLSRIQGKCSLGAPCLLTLAPWLAEDCPWTEIKCSRNPALDVAALAIQRGPSAKDPFWSGGKGKHPVAGLTGGLQLNPGFRTISPRSAFFRRTGQDGEYLPDEGDWTEGFEFKEYRRERFVGEIVWNRPDSEILEDFEEWLKWRRSLLPEKFQKMAKRASRTRWDDPAAALRDLAALRLRAAYGATAGGRQWAEMYSSDSIDKRFQSGAIETQARRAAADAKARFKEWLGDWNMDSAQA